MSLHVTDTHLATDKHPGLVSRLIDWWLKGPPGHDIDRLSAKELEMMSHDLGLQPSELVQLSRRDADAELLLYRRLELLGLSASEAERLGLKRDLERTCSLCAEQGICRHDLEMRPDSSDWKSYCPNSGVLETFKAEIEKAAPAEKQSCGKSDCSCKG